MKILQNLFLAIVLLFTFGCSDPCDNVSCGPGICIDGTCECPSGYEGGSCEIESKSNFYNKYITQSMDCGDSFESTFEWFEISERSGGINNIKFKFSSDGTIFNLDGTITNRKLKVVGEIGTYSLDISGSFSTTNKEFTGIVAIPGFVSCDAVFVAN